MIWKLSMSSSARSKCHDDFLLVLCFSRDKCHHKVIELSEKQLVSHLIKLNILESSSKYTSILDAYLTNGDCTTASHLFLRG